MKFYKFCCMCIGFCLFVCVMSVNVFDNVAKADTVKTEQGVAIRSTNLVTNKVIKVPDRSNGTLINGSDSSLSRGGNVSDGANSNGQKVVNYARKFMGSPYVWGAAGPKAFDCSGLTMYVYRAFGVSLPHYTGSQFGVGQAVNKKDLRPGDLVFFNTYSSISHVGIYVGNGNFMHAPSSGKNVTISNLGEGYYGSKYAGARRILK